MPKRRHPELEGYQYQPLYTFELKSRRKAIRNRLLWTLTGLSIGLGFAALAYLFVPQTKAWLTAIKEPQLPADDPFRKGSIQAMSAAELTQKAEFQEDWSQVALLWQQAINYMLLVNDSHPNHSTAQQKILEYDRNLKYAQSNVASRTSSNPDQKSFWTLGSDRDLVIAVQGMPERVVQYDTSCKESFYYGDSVVELRNGYVIEYSDSDNNLKVLADQKVALSIQSGKNTWTLGNSEEEVFRMQGTPTRTLSYKDSTTLYYGNSSVELSQGYVVGYSNIDKNLNVSVKAVASPDKPVNSSWSLGDSRAEVLAVEKKTPTSVKRQDLNCEEIFDFEANTVVFKNGLVYEYSNSGNSLNVQ